MSVVLCQLLVDQFGCGFNIARTSGVLPGLNDSASTLSIDHIEIVDGLLILLGRTEQRVIPAAVKMEERLSKYCPVESGALTQDGDAGISSLVEREIDHAWLEA